MSNKSNSCSFCDRPSFAHQVIIENGHFFVIHSRRPLSRGHVMILPREHIPGPDIPAGISSSFFDISNKMFSALSQAFDCHAYNFFANFGKKAGQEIGHLHFHIVPRYDSEKMSPFEILNNRELRSQMSELPREQMSAEIAAIQKFLNK